MGTTRQHSSPLFPVWGHLSLCRAWLCPLAFRLALVSEHCLCRSLTGRQQRTSTAAPAALGSYTIQGCLDCMHQPPKAHTPMPASHQLHKLPSSSTGLPSASSAPEHKEGSLPHALCCQLCVSQWVRPIITLNVGRRLLQRAVVDHRARGLCTAARGEGGTAKACRRGSGFQRWECKRAEGSLARKDKTRKLQGAR